MWNKAQFGTLTAVNLCSSSYFSPSLTTPPSDSLLISVAGMAVYTGYVFMPQHIMAILHYFEVVQWHGDPARLPLASRPSTCLAGLSARRLLGSRWGLFPTTLRQDFFLLLFTADSMAKVNALHIVHKVKLGEVISWGCFPFTETFGLKGRRGGCAWFRFMCCFCLLKSSAPHSLENMLIMWTSDYALLVESLFYQDIKPLWSKF